MKKMLVDLNALGEWQITTMKAYGLKIHSSDMPKEYPCVVAWSEFYDDLRRIVVDFEFVYISEFMDVDLKCFTGGPAFIFTPVLIEPADHP